MTYQATDASIQDGSPFELYSFVTGALRHAYTSNVASIVYGADTYLPAQITRGKITHTTEFMRGELSIRVPVSLPVAAMFLPGSPSKPTEVRIYRRHILDGAAETAQVWRGRVLSMKVEGMEAELVCGQLYGSMQRMGLRGNCQVGCRHALYDENCTVDRTLHDYAGNTASVIGSTVVVPGASAKPDGWYDGGLFVWGETSRLIVRHVGDILNLLAPVPDLTGGQPVTIYPGCDRSHATCTSKFNNDYFHGGYPWMPVKNPFVGDGVA
ncbi:MAG: phage BR0599 family protein [Thiobacillus sp.]|jgi:uncharacterized phage protein (TIGR02218 family)|uniref:phage BR0599 family protein n=1 Tax=Thiobacillus sp. TaxID=924 RepID=UPI002893A63E|nr:phage BR0599 family protein [Thiobacillus sp.]MDT3707485.1 phage BR0599 family protein [Thiobacillus sp.]